LFAVHTEGKVKAIVLAGLVAAVVVNGAAAGPVALKLPSARTLATVPGTIEAFAQDSNHLVWAKSDQCGRNVALRTLSSGKTSYLDGRNGPMCRLTEIAGGIQSEMALAGTRALWAYVDVSLSHYNFSLFSGAPADVVEEKVAEMSIEGGLEDEGDAYHPVPVAGHGRTLVYADINTEESTPSGVYQVLGKRIQHVEGTQRAFSIAVAGYRFALARAIPGGCACNWNPQWSPDGRRIAFISGRGEGGTEFEHPQLFVMNADGSGLQHVIDDVFEFAWAPDGGSFAVRQEDTPGGRDRLAVVRADGSGARMVASASSFAWSPDGRRLAYVSQDPSGYGQLFVVAATGGEAVALGDASANDPIEWSRDSTRLAYTRLIGQEGHVYVSTTSGGPATDLGFGAWPTWSPDDAAIAFLRQDDGIYVAAPNGAGAHRVAAVKAAMPRWSPDGRWISYTGLEGLSIVRPDGSGQRSLAQGEVGAMDWSPDSHAIVYTDSQGATNITIVDVNSGETTLTTRACGGLPHWSPDGPRIVCESPTDNDLGGEIAVLDPRSGGITTLTQTKPAPTRMVVETRGAGGELQSSFDAPSGLRGIGWDGSHFALVIGRSKTRSTIEITSPGGEVLRSVTVPRPNSDFVSMSGRWLVFQSRRTGWLLDTVNGKARALAQPKRRTFIVGLSIDGRRVAWAESGASSSRIRSILLPSG
jgi:Tol biopolymer transport system component